MSWAEGEACVAGPTPWWCCVQGSCAVTCFCSRLLRSGPWFVAFLYLIVHNVSQLPLRVVIFSTL